MKPFKKTLHFSSSSKLKSEEYQRGAHNRRAEPGSPSATHSDMPQFQVPFLTNIPNPLLRKSRRIIFCLARPSSEPHAPCQPPCLPHAVFAAEIIERRQRCPTCRDPGEHFNSYVTCRIRHNTCVIDCESLLCEEFFLTFVLLLHL